MLRTPVKDRENIEDALIVYKRKFMRTQIKNRLQENKEYTKASVSKRAQFLKSAVRSKIKRSSNRIRWYNTYYKIHY